MYVTQLIAMKTACSFSAASDSWTAVSTTGQAPSARTGHAAVIVDDVMYVIGGTNGKTAFGDIWALSLSTLQWNIVGSSGFVPRSHHSASVVDGKIYVHGGKSSSGTVLNSMDIFDPGM